MQRTVTFYDCVVEKIQNDLQKLINNWWGKHKKNHKRVHSLSKHGFETPLKSLFYLFVRVYAVSCMVHGQRTHCISV
jgi:hypothetical protein